MRLDGPHIPDFFPWLVVALLPFLWQCTPSTVWKSKGFRALKAFKKSEKRGYRPRRIALLIGIDKYKDETWHPLRYAAKDAGDLARVLGKKSLGYFDDLMLHVSTRNTTRASILRVFKRLLELNKDPRDTVFVYISAHGTLSRDRRHRLLRYLVTQDADAKDLSRTAISVDLLRGFFGKLKSEKKVMLLATCHSGAGKSRLTRFMSAELRTYKGPFFVKPIEAVSRATIFLGVCGFGETARESRKLRNDIYTYYFIKALKSRYDLNGDGAITVMEAHDYAKELTYHHTKGQQRAYAESDILGSDPIILVGKKKRLGKPVLYAYKQRFFGVEVRVNGNPKGTFPRGIKLRTGKQKITLVAQNGKSVLFDGEVDVRAGERLEVGKLLKRQVFRYSLSTKGGYQFFLQGTSESRISRPLPLLGVDFKLRNPFQLPLDLRFEFAFSHDSHVLQEQDNRSQTITELNFGLALTYNFKIQWFCFFVGLRLSAIYLGRESGLHREINDFFYSFQPGLLLGTEFRLALRWSLFAEARLNYTYITMEEGPPKHQGSYEMLGGVSFHF